MAPEIRYNPELSLPQPANVNEMENHLYRTLIQDSTDSLEPGPYPPRTPAPEPNVTSGVQPSPRFPLRPISPWTSYPSSSPSYHEEHNSKDKEDDLLDVYMCDAPRIGTIPTPDDWPRYQPGWFDLHDHGVDYEVAGMMHAARMEMEENCIDPSLRVDSGMEVGRDVADHRLERGTLEYEDCVVGKLDKERMEEGEDFNDERFAASTPAEGSTPADSTSDTGILTSPLPSVAANLHRQCMENAQKMPMPLFNKRFPTPMTLEDSNRVDWRSSADTTSTSRASSLPATTNHDRMKDTHAVASHRPATALKHSAPGQDWIDHEQHFVARRLPDPTPMEILTPVCGTFTAYTSSTPSDSTTNSNRATTSRVPTPSLLAVLRNTVSPNNFTPIPTSLNTSTPIPPAPPHPSPSPGTTPPSQDVSHPIISTNPSTISLSTPNTCSSIPPTVPSPHPTPPPTTDSSTNPIPQSSPQVINQVLEVVPGMLSQLEQLVNAASSTKPSSAEHDALGSFSASTSHPSGTKSSSNFTPPARGSETNTILQALLDRVSALEGDVQSDKEVLRTRKVDMECMKRRVDILEEKLTRYGV